MQLIVEIRNEKGSVRKWKVRNDKPLLTFGRSKDADLRYPSPEVKNLHGAFEYRFNKAENMGHWHFVHFDIENEKAEIIIDRPTLIRLGDTDLEITPLAFKSPLLSHFNEPGSEADVSNSNLVLVALYQNNRLVQTDVAPAGETYHVFDGNEDHPIRLEKTNSWKETKIGFTQIYTRSISSLKAEEIRKLTEEKFLERKSWVALGAMFAFMVVMGGLSLRTPHGAEAPVAALPENFMQEIKMEPPKVKPPEPKKTASARTSPAQASAPLPDADSAKNNGGGASRSASAIKSFASGRITQLIGKISAASARSKNIVITSGIKAGEGPSGRALAAVGNLSQPGKDLSNDLKGNGGISISTNGKAGGKNVSGLGKLATGATGNGGVGLIEEESEIVGGLDPEVIAQYIRTQLGQILYCYERQLSAQPDLYGKVAVKFTIGANGLVETQKIGETTLKSQMVESCILTKVSAWKFPVPQGGTKVNVTYPFLFKSTN